MRRMAYSVFVAVLLALAGAAQAGPSIIITEVFYDTPGTDSIEEWVEFFNPTGGTIDIGGWTLHDNSTFFTFPGGTILMPGQTFVLAKNAAGFNALYGFNPDLDGLNLNLSNSGDFLQLFDLSNQLVDEVGWEGALPGWNIEAATGESLKRVFAGSGPAAWAGNQSPMPGTHSPIPEPGTLVLVGSGVVLLVGWKRRFSRR